MSAARPWAIKIDGVSKRYRLGVLDSNLRQTIADTTRGILSTVRGQAAAAPSGSFWALRDVSLEIERGQIVGVIGHNGAGKSTLLKILARITEPTEGTVQFVGNVGSLLEVGTGFHPELSGRDNVFLNGAVLGMTHRQVSRYFDQIVDFAGVEQFIDTPVKRYSSGMYMRLAFAVAAHLESEILLVDEVLAVGDSAFQKKCLGRIGEMAHDGRTVVFVSHNLAAVQSLCSRAVLLDKGRVVVNGPTGKVLQAYLHQGDGGPATQRRWSREQAPRSSRLCLRGVSVGAVDGDPLAPLSITEPFRITFEYERSEGAAGAQVSVKLVNAEGVLVFDLANSADAPNQPGLYRESCVVPADLLNAGEYRLSITLNDGGSVDAPDVVAFELLDSDRDRRGWYGVWEGVMRPRLQWSCELLPTASA